MNVNCRVEFLKSQLSASQKVERSVTHFLVITNRSDIFSITFIRVKLRDSVRTHQLRLHLHSAQGNPVGTCPGLGSVWVSGQVQFPGYIVKNYPRSTFDLAVFGGKFNSSWRRSQIAKRMACLRSFFCFLYGNNRSKNHATLKEIELMGI